MEKSVVVSMGDSRRTYKRETNDVWYQASSSSLTPVTDQSLIDQLNSARNGTRILIEGESYLATISPPVQGKRF